MPGPDGTRPQAAERQQRQGEDAGPDIGEGFAGVWIGARSTVLPGVTIDEKNSTTLLSGDSTQGYITLQAAADAPAVDNQQTVVMANVAINFVMKATYCSRPFTVSVVR